MIYQCTNEHLFNCKYAACPICGKPVQLTVEEMLECRIEQAIAEEEAKRPYEELPCDDLPDPIELEDGIVVFPPKNRRDRERFILRKRREMEAV